MTMQKIQHERITPSTLYPNGWFVLCFASELKPKAVETEPFMGEVLVLYRTESGAVRAIEPFCPHLGAHLGRGGKIVGETIACPFHHFAFTADGHCLHTPSGIKPPQARLTLRQVQEWHGMILVWQGSDVPHVIWKLPDVELAGFSTPIKSNHITTGDFQNIAENTVDLNHFAPLHGWKKAVMQPPKVEDHQLTAQYTMEVLGFYGASGRETLDVPTLDQKPTKFGPDNSSSPVLARPRDEKRLLHLEKQMLRRKTKTHHK